MSIKNTQNKHLDLQYVVHIVHILNVAKLYLAVWMFSDAYFNKTAFIANIIIILINRFLLRSLILCFC